MDALVPELLDAGLAAPTEAGPRQCHAASRNAAG